MAMDLNDYKIIKEGEAEILMQPENEVFYNKAQVSKSHLSSDCCVISEKNADYTMLYSAFVVHEC